MSLMNPILTSLGFLYYRDGTLTAFADLGAGSEAAEQYRQYEQDDQQRQGPEQAAGEPPTPSSAPPLPLPRAGREATPRRPVNASGHADLRGLDRHVRGLGAILGWPQT
jgi:hypothetical protein